MKECPICLKSKKQVQSLFLKAQICSICKSQDYLTFAQACFKMGYSEGIIRSDLNNEEKKYERMPKHNALLYIKGHQPRKLWSTKIIDARMDGWPDLIESEIRELNSTGARREDMAKSLGVTLQHLNHFCYRRKIISERYLHVSGSENKKEDYSNFIRAESLFNKAMRS